MGSTVGEDLTITATDKHQVQTLMARHVVHTNESLFPLMEGRVPYVSDSTNSRAAAGAVQEKAPTQKQIVHTHIKARGIHGVADWEGIRDLKEQITSIENAYRARRDNLAKEGRIKKRHLGRTSPAGLAVDVWIDASVTDTTTQETQS
jgi:hypothetical protein